jgi:hypothetical protein
MTKISGSVLVGIVLFSVGMVTALQAAQTGVSCPTPMRLKAIIGENGQTTFATATTFATIPQTTVNFVQGGTVASCVAVRFSGETGAAGVGFMEVRAVLDGVTIAPPGAVRFGVSEGTEVARSYEFIFKQVAPGAHVLRMEFRSSNGVSTFVSNRTTSVLFQP